MDDVKVAIGLFVAGPLMFAVAALLTLFRGELGQLNVALVLAMLVVASAIIGGRIAGVSGAVMASLSFNFLHTKPYLSLRIHSDRDIVMTVMLLVVGAAVGEFAMRTDRARRQLEASREMLHDLESLSGLVAGVAGDDEVWACARRILTKNLPIHDCRFERFGTEAPPLPRITRAEPVPRSPRKRFTGNGFLLPDTGAELAVSHRGEMLGRIVLVPNAETGVAIERRRFALAVAETFASSFRSPRHEL